MAALRAASEVGHSVTLENGRASWWGWPAVATVSLAATVLSWRAEAWGKVTRGLDASWQAALAVGFERHLQWGPQIVFTYGPYGLVDTLLPFYRTTTLVVVVFAVLVSWGLAALMVSALRPAWGLLPAGVVAWAALAIANNRAGFTDISGAVALGLALAALRKATTSRRLAFIGLLGALAGFSLLTKFNLGVVALGLLVVVVLAEGTERSLGKAFVAGFAPFLIVFLAAWAGAGQSFGNLVSYFRGSLSVATGYSSAMGLEGSRDAENVYGLIVVVLLAVVFNTSVTGSLFRSTPRSIGAHSPRAPRLPVVRQVAIGVSVVGWTFAVLKEGFVRHDTHDLTFFGLAVAALALAQVPRRLVPLQAGALVVAASLACVATGSVPPQLYSPGASAGALLSDVRAAVGLGGFSRSHSRLEADLLATAGNALPANAVSLARGHTVAVEPLDDVAAYLYPGLAWDAEPVLQGYSAYTNYLDRLDASFLGSSAAPERIIYRTDEAIDGRDPWMDPPATIESMYCHYGQLAVASAWQVLERVPDRCGDARLVARVTAKFGEAVAVPVERGDLVAATLSFSLPLRYGVEDVLFRPPKMLLRTWAAGRRAGSGRRTYRFVPGTAGDLHVLSTPPALGYSPAFTPPALREISLEGGGWAKGQGRVSVSFYAIRIAPARPVSGRR